MQSLWRLRNADMTRQGKLCGCSVEHMMKMLRDRPERERIQAIMHLLPVGYALSSPGREELIWRMEKTLAVMTAKPKQYSYTADRPDAEG
jgi:hypothetical protein